MQQMLDGIRTTKLTEKERDASVEPLSELKYEYANALGEDDLATGIVQHSIDTGSSQPV